MAHGDLGCPLFRFSRILRLPVVSGGLGYGDRQHNPDEYMTAEGLRELEKFVVTSATGYLGGIAIHI